jgi:hypothetical protein
MSSSVDLSPRSRDGRADMDDDELPAEALAHTILEEVYALYTNPSSVNAALGKRGLLSLASEVGLTPPLLPPRRRLSVLLIGECIKKASERRRRPRGTCVGRMG